MVRARTRLMNQLQAVALNEGLRYKKRSDSTSGPPKSVRWSLSAGPAMGFFAFLTVPPGPPFPEHLHNKKMCGIVWCYTGPIKKAEKVFKPIRSFKAAALDMVGRFITNARSVGLILLNDWESIK